MDIQIVKGDITKETTDAIVNAANNSLMGGGGVDGAIHRAGGPQILEECKKIRAKSGDCPTGEAVYTNAGLMPSKYVIHTVGPVWRGGEHGEEHLLEACYRKSLEIAEDLQLKSIAFPNISTGVYGFPKAMAAQIALKSVSNFKAKSLELVRFICFDEENYRLYYKYESK